PVLPSSQPAARHPPTLPYKVLEETEKQWLFSEDELRRTPSVADGMTPETERELRGKGVNFISQVGIMLKLPQLTLSTAAVFFNRFLMRNSLVDKPGRKALHHYQVAATAVFLATKVEENCRKVKELVIACCRVAQKNPNLIVDEQSKDYWRWKDTILLNEDVLLENLCFDLTIEAPHKIFYEYLKLHGVEHHRELRNAGWAFLNDAILTQLCLLFPSRTIAAAALYCAARYCAVAFPDSPPGRPWWEMHGVRLTDIRRACKYMVNCYENTPLRPGMEAIYVSLRSP
ncbi:cyclin-like protein, partial [Viridothelium virens]